MSVTVPSLANLARPARDSAGPGAAPLRVAAPPELDAARLAAREMGLGYSGDVEPLLAQELVAAGRARLVDVRSAEERKFVGHPIDSLHVPWAQGIALQRNPRFLRELESRVQRDEVLLFICRSGVRSAAAAAAATAARFPHAFSVREGFEGDLDARGQRGHRGGWRSHGLPWIQD